MQFVWKMPGEWYHEHKDKFKVIRDEYGRLKYLGFLAMAWQSEKEKVSILAERYIDPKDGKEKSKEVTLSWEGAESTWLLEQMKEMFKDFIVDEMRVELLTFDASVQAEVCVMLTSLNRPPDGYINMFIKDKIAERKAILP